MSTDGFLPTNSIRFVIRERKTDGLPVSSQRILQQWWFNGSEGQWRDVATLPEDNREPAHRQLIGIKHGPQPEVF